MCNNSNQDLVSINAYAKLGQIPSICSEDIEWKKNLDNVYVEVLWPSQPNGVMLSVVSLPNHTFTGQASSSKWLTSIMHSFARKKKIMLLIRKNWCVTIPT